MTYPLKDAQALTAEFQRHVADANERGVSIEAQLDYIFRLKEILEDDETADPETYEARAAETRKAWEDLRIYRGEADHAVYIEAFSRKLLSTLRVPVDASNVGVPAPKSVGTA